VMKRARSPHVGVATGEASINEAATPNSVARRRFLCGVSHFTTFLLSPARPS
jgi:hypothetical protein